MTGEIASHSGHATVLATGGYSNAFFLSTNAMGCNVTAIWRAHRRGAYFANPCFTQIHPTCIPPERRVPVQAHADVGVAAQRRPHLGARRTPDDARPPSQIPEDDRDYYLERLYPSFGNLVPRDIASRAAKRAVDSGRGVGPLKNGVYLDFADAIARVGRDVIEERYGNLFEMYERITDEDPYRMPMRIYPAPHYTMGGLWVDYELMTTVPGLYAVGEANFSDHGANRLGASALMQGLADGYFVLPATIGNYLAPRLGDQAGAHRPPRVPGRRERRPGPLRRATWPSRGPARSTGSTASWAGSCGTTAAWSAPPRACRRRSPRSPRCTPSSARTSGCSARPGVNQSPRERAGRVDDFFELAS